MNQLLTNILQNAADSIGETQEGVVQKGVLLKKDKKKAIGTISIRGFREGTNLVLWVDDTGKGLPDSGRERLMEPYYTTRKAGTGLGLSIVRKIMEDHGGSIVLKNRDEGGARVILSFPEESLYAK